MSIVFALLLAALGLFVPGATHDRSQGSLPAPQASGRVGPPLAAIAGSAAVFDLASGTFLLTKEAHRSHPPGALAKIAAAALLVSRADASDPMVQLSRDAAFAPGYNLLLETGELVPRSELLKAMMFLPGYDAAQALATHQAGSAPAFVAQMNEWVQALGLEHTYFVNPHGLDAPDHRTTAHDMAVIAAHALALPEVRALSGQVRTVIALGDGRTRSVRHINSFLWLYPGATGMQSSYTPASGYALVGSARQHGVELIVVVLGAPSAPARFETAKYLLDYSFQHRKTLLAAPAIDQIRYEVVEGDTLSRIGARFHAPVSLIQKMNGIADSDRLQSGALLWIPR